MSNDASPKELGLDDEASPFEPSPSLSVSLRSVDGRSTLVMRTRLAGDRTSIWAHVTNPRLLSAWAPYSASRELAALGEVTLVLLEAGPIAVPPQSDIVFEVDRPRALEHSWGRDVLRWELSPVDDGTDLELRQTLSDPTTAPAVAAGWHLCLDVLARLLAGEPVEPVRGVGARHRGWDELNHEYSAKLG